MGPSIFVTLALFAVFFSLAFRYRRTRELHNTLHAAGEHRRARCRAFRVIGA
jgi:hypothetical protein